MKSITNKQKVLGLFLVAASFIVISCGGSGSGTTAEAESTSSEPMVPINEVFKILAEENNQTRKLYTKGIVGPGKKNGLKFDEDWEKDDVEAGPLPALFLRGAASEIAQGDYELGLFLGSDFNIGKGNQFTGVQAEKFVQMRKDTQPQFFFDKENDMYVAMFADMAMAGPCVSCHNDHPNTPKDDWVLGDIMGATTWMYPKGEVPVSELKALVNEYRTGAKSTYNSFLEECKEFKTAEVPAIGDDWFKGYKVPSADRFMDSVYTVVGPTTEKAIAKFQ